MQRPMKQVGKPKHITTRAGQSASRSGVAAVMGGAAGRGNQCSAVEAKTHVMMRGS
jgi:hypothetical protein